MTQLNEGAWETTTLCISIYQQLLQSRLSSLWERSISEPWVLSWVHDKHQGKSTNLKDLPSTYIKHHHKSPYPIADSWQHLAKLGAWESRSSHLHAKFHLQVGEHFCFTLLEPIEIGLRAFWALHAAEPGCSQPSLVFCVLECPREKITRLSVSLHILFTSASSRDSWTL